MSDAIDERDSIGRSYRDLVLAIEGEIKIRTLEARRVIERGRKELWRANESSGMMFEYLPPAALKPEEASEPLNIHTVTLPWKKFYFRQAERDCVVMEINDALNLAKAFLLQAVTFAEALDDHDILMWRRPLSIEILQPFDGVGIMVVPKARFGLVKTPEEFRK